MFAIIKDKWPLWLILALFVILQLPHLFYPYYWDESWSYAPAISLMYKHGPSLLPGVIDVEASRGHPLFFYASAATWMHLFGNSTPARHCFALFISVLQLSAVYVIANKLFNIRVAIFATALLAAQVSFFVQASMVLPEILVGLLVFISIYFYVQGKYLSCFLALSCLFLTKESGLVLGLVLGTDAFIGLFRKKEIVRKRLYTFGSIACAITLIGSFFLYQHHVYGWYFYPGHTGLINTTWNYIHDKSRDYINILFLHDKSWRMYGLLLLLSVLAAIRKKQYSWLIYLLPGIIFYLYLADKPDFIDKRPLLLLVILSFTAAIYQTAFFIKNPIAKRFVLLGGIFLLAYMGFTSCNFYTQRYLLPAMVWTILFVAIWLDLLLKRLSLYLYIPIVLLLTINIFKAYKYSNGHGDCDLGAFTTMKTQKQAINYLESINAYDAHIITSSAQQMGNLTNPDGGYLMTQRIFRNISYKLTGQTDIILFDNIDPDFRYDSILRTKNFIKIFNTSNKSTWSEIYSSQAFYQKSQSNSK